MNKKGNQRTVQTEQRIKEIFLELLKKKKLSQISVSEICSLAGIHRTTFYVHYQDVYDLMEKMAGDMYVQAMGFFLQEESGLKGDGFKKLFEMIQEHQEFFGAYLEASKNTKWEDQLIPGLLEERADRIYHLMGFASREELFYHQTFFTAGLTAIIKRWISRDCKETPAEMSRILTEEYTADKSYFWKQEKRKAPDTI